MYRPNKTEGKRLAVALGFLLVAGFLATGLGAEPLELFAEAPPGSLGVRGTRHRVRTVHDDTDGYEGRIRHLIIGLGTLGVKVVEELLPSLMQESHDDVDPATVETFTADSNPNDNGPGTATKLKPDLVFGEVDMTEVKRGKETVHRDLNEIADLEAAPDGVAREAKQNRTRGLAFGWAAFRDILRWLKTGLTRLLNGAHGTRPGGSGHRQVVVTIVTGAGGTGTSLVIFFAGIIRRLSGGNVRIRLVFIEPIPSARDRWTEEIIAQTLREQEKDRELTRAGVEHTIIYPGDEKPTRIARALDAVLLIQEQNMNDVGVGGRDGLARAAAGIVRMLCFTPFGAEWNAAQENIPEETVQTADGQTVVPVVESVGYERLVWDAAGIRDRCSLREAARGLRYQLGSGTSHKRAETLKRLQEATLRDQDWLAEQLEIPPVRQWSPSDGLVSDRKRFRSVAPKLAQAHVEAARLDRDSFAERAANVEREIESHVQATVIELVNSEPPLGAVQHGLDSVREEVASRGPDPARMQKRVERSKAAMDSALQALSRTSGLVALLFPWLYTRRARRVVEAVNRVARDTRQLELARLHRSTVVPAADSGLAGGAGVISDRTDLLEEVLREVQVLARGSVDNAADRFIPKDPGARFINRPSDDEEAYEQHALGTPKEAGDKLARALGQAHPVNGVEPTVDDVIRTSQATFQSQFEEVLATDIRDHLPVDETELQEFLAGAYDRAAPRVGLKNGGPQGVHVCHLGLPKSCEGIETHLPGVDRVITLESPYEIVVFRGVHQIPLASIEKFEDWAAKLDAMAEDDYRCTRIFPRWWSTRHDRLETLCRAVLVQIVRPDSTNRNYREYRVTGPEPDDWPERSSNQIRGISWREAVRIVNEDDVYADRLGRSLRNLEGLLGKAELLERVEKALGDIDSFPKPARKDLNEVGQAWIDEDLADGYRFRREEESYGNGNAIEPTDSEPVGEDDDEFPKLPEMPEPAETMSEEAGKEDEAAEA